MTNQNDHKTRVLFKQTLILTRQYLLTTPYFESHISIPSFTMVSARRWFLLLVIQTLKCSLFIKKSFLQSFHDVLLSVIKFSTKTFYNALARGPFWNDCEIFIVLCGILVRKISSILLDIIPWFKLKNSLSSTTTIFFTVSRMCQSHQIVFFTMNIFVFITCPLVASQQAWKQLFLQFYWSNSLINGC